MHFNSGMCKYAEVQAIMISMYIIWQYDYDVSYNCYMIFFFPLKI